MTDVKKTPYDIIFIFAVVLVTLLVYFPTLNNGYSIDDEWYVTPQITKGVEAIPDILVTNFAYSNGVGASYRAVPRILMACEYEIFEGGNTKLSHFINLTLYILLLVIIFNTFKIGVKRHILFIAIILFCVHPVHVEVVASIKNRDILLSILFGFISLRIALSYYIKPNLLKFIFLFVAFLLGLASKETIHSFILLIPLTLCFFEKDNIKWKDIALVSSCLIFATILYWAFYSNVLTDGQVFYTQTAKDSYWYLENPLMYENRIMVRLGTAFNSLLAYVKLFVWPFPLSFFYGYGTVRMESCFNVLPVVSLVIHLLLLLLAIKMLKRKHVVSLAIFWYLIALFMFSNLPVSIPGIIAERYFFLPCLGASLLVGYCLIKLGLKYNRKGQVMALIISLIVLVSFIYKSHTRAKEWKSVLSIARIDEVRNTDAALINGYLVKELLNQKELGLQVDSSEILYNAYMLIKKVPFDSGAYGFATKAYCELNLTYEDFFTNSFKKELIELQGDSIIVNQRFEEIKMLLCNDINF